MKESVKHVISLRKQGMTYDEIRTETGASKGTISYICRRYIEDNDLLVARNMKSLSSPVHSEKAAAALASLRAAEKNTRKNEWTTKLQLLPLTQVVYIAGLYAGEGTHTRTEFCLSNSKYSLVEKFIEFLQAVGIDYTCSLNIHTSMNRGECVSYWEQLVPIHSVLQYDTRTQKKSNYAREYFGTVRVRALKPLGLRDALQEVSGFPV